MLSTLNLAGVFLDDAVSDGQAQAGAAPLPRLRVRFSGEEWIVNALQMLRAIPDPCVETSTALHGRSLRRHAQCTARRHRIFGIQEEVQKDLL